VNEHEWFEHQRRYREGQRAVHRFEPAQRIELGGDEGLSEREPRPPASRIFKYAVEIETTDHRSSAGADLYQRLSREVELRFGKTARVEWTA
jgi:hypothetical protein